MDVGKVLVLEMLFLLDFKLFLDRNILLEERQLGTEDYRV